MPEADRERVFERFARANSGSDAEGTGLGLAITRAIAQAHGGDVQLDPRVEDGARFVVTIPIEPPQEVSPLEPDTDR